MEKAFRSQDVIRFKVGPSMAGATAGFARRPLRRKRRLATWDLIFNSEA